MTFNKGKYIEEHERVPEHTLIINEPGNPFYSHVTLNGKKLTLVAYRVEHRAKDFCRVTLEMSAFRMATDLNIELDDTVTELVIAGETFRRVKS